MTAPIIALPLSIAEGSSGKKKRVLLLDTSQPKRDLRANVMRKLGIEERIAFFVGGPEYLAATPHSDQLTGAADADSLQKELAAVLLATGSAVSQQRWGILEACKRISSVRSVSEARSRAIRELPQPSRWAEAIEQHSTPEATNPQPLFPTERELL